MDCPDCHAPNAAEASKCTTCGHVLPPDNKPARESRAAERRRRSEAQRREKEAREAAAVDTNNPLALRAYHVSLWAMVPGLGLLLGPLAVILGWRAARLVRDDRSALNRCGAAVLFGLLITLTQWLGILLILYGWRE